MVQLPPTIQDVLFAQRVIFSDRPQILKVVTLLAVLHLRDLVNISHVQEALQFALVKQKTISR